MVFYQIKQTSSYSHPEAAYSYTLDDHRNSHHVITFHHRTYYIQLFFYKTMVIHQANKYFHNNKCSISPYISTQSPITYWIIIISLAFTNNMILPCGVAPSSASWPQLISSDDNLIYTKNQQIKAYIHRNWAENACVIWFWAVHVHQKANSYIYRINILMLMR